MEETFKQLPNIKNTYDELIIFCKKYIVDLKPPGLKNNMFGRIYDYSILKNVEEVNFENKIICDLGARCGFFGLYLSTIANRVDISDYFKLWDSGLENGLNDFNKEKIFVDTISQKLNTSHKVNLSNEDITNLSYADCTYDIVLCTSVIEHLFTQSIDKNGKYNGDIKGINEIKRICKKGGYILLSTDMSNLDTSEFPNNSIDRWYSGTYWYNEKELFDRIINIDGLQLVGNYNYSFDNKYNDCISSINNLYPNFKVSPCIIILKKNL